MKTIKLNEEEIMWLNVYLKILITKKDMLFFSRKDVRIVNQVLEKIKYE